jgi:hypothetical protein
MPAGGVNSSLRAATWAGVYSVPLKIQDSSKKETTMKRLTCILAALAMVMWTYIPA